jgi:hypothetical protein
MRASFDAHLTALSVDGPTVLLTEGTNRSEPPKNCHGSTAGPPYMI